MFKDLEEAKAFVRADSKLIKGAQSGHFTFVEIAIPYAQDGRAMKYQASGFSKYNPNDAKRGLPYSEKQGREIAVDRAVTLIAEALMVDQQKYVISSMMDKLLADMPIETKAG
jgi:hypothetical protein